MLDARGRGGGRGQKRKWGAAWLRTAGKFPSNNIDKRHATKVDAFLGTIATTRAT